MTANKNEPDKKPAGSAPVQAGNRPHATLDLKATEVAPPAKETAQDKPTVAEASDKSKATAPPTGASASASAGKSAASGPATSSGAKPESKADKPASTPPPASSPSRPAPRGSGGFFTHLAAGLAGGIVALLVADILAAQLGFETADKPENVAAIEQRLGALEQGRNQRAVPSNLAARLAAAEAKLGNVERADASIEGVSKKQAEFEKQLDALSDKIGEGADAQATARIAKLEEQLALMSSAATNDPRSGPVPQLAAITGKLADLESTVSTQLDALRKSVAQEVDQRLGAATEAAQASRSGTQRMDRELSTLKAETAEIQSGIAGVKTDSDRAAAALKATQEDLKRLKADLDARLATFARPEDVTSVVGPLSTRLSALQEDVQGVIKSEGDRRTTAERIVLSLELANLKRAIDRGKAYAPELEQAQKVAGTIVDLSPLERFALDGVPTSTELRAQFKPVAFKVIDSEEQPTDASIVDRLLAGAKSVVRVRKTNHAADDKSIEAVVGRMETALNEDRLADVLAQAKTLPQPAQDAAQEFLAKVQARDAVDRALASVETQLKSSLAAAPAEPKANAAQ
jgi:hypothetical protein